jgi:hypothetical protein
MAATATAPTACGGFRQLVGLFIADGLGQADRGRGSRGGARVAVKTPVKPGDRLTFSVDIEDM